MFNKCNTLIVSQNAPSWEEEQIPAEIVKWKLNMSFYVLCAKYFPPLEHNPLRNNVSFIQTFAFGPLISDYQMS